MMPRMPIRSHRWDLPPKEALALQRQLAAGVLKENRLNEVKTVAGVDVGQREGMVQAAVAVLTFPDLALKNVAVAKRRVNFPYIPGLLGFREGPVILDAIDQLSKQPDLFIFDGQGIAHPRRLGIASHIGLLTGMPSVGCAKSRLCGQHIEPGTERGSRVPLLDDREVIGAVVRTRTGVKPVYVSVGYGVDLETAVEYVLACCRGFRLPETTRLAHRLAAITS